MYMRVGPARMDPARIDEDSTLVQDIAEAFMNGRNTNPLFRNRSLR